MRRRFRILRILKWSGTVVCALVVAAFVISLAWSIAYVHAGSQRILGLGIDSGTLWIGVMSGVWSPYMQPSDVGWIVDVPSQSWEWTLNWADPIAKDPSAWKLSLPLLPLFLLFAAPTLLFWYLDRHRPGPGRCRRCNYDLTGNLSGVCPECGAGVTSSV